MMTQAEKGRQQILAKLYSFIKKHAAPSKVEILINFAKTYFSMVSYEDLAERKIDDIYWAMYSHWKFIYERKPGECKIKVFNPTLSEDNWQSTHTAVLIVHDDMPFLVDSVRMEINRHGYLIHHIIHVGGIRLERDKNYHIKAVLPRDKPTPNSMIDAPIYVEIDRQTDQQVLDNLQECLIRVLSDVTAAVSDWQLMLDRLDQSLMGLEQSPPPLDPAEITESKAFLRWLKDNFIFLGCRDYKMIEINGEMTMQAVARTGTGVLREDSKKHLRYLSEMPPEARRLALSSHILIIAKTNTKSTIHRNGYTDYVGVKMFDSKGKVIGERRFVGLYTSSAYNSNPKHIPFLRLKVAKVLQSSGFVPNSHAGKKLLNILETFPRDDLFQALPEELLVLTMGIFHLQERQRIRLFMRKDSYGRYYSCLVFVPRESFNTEITRQMEEILREMLHGEEVTYSILFSESILARIHFMVRIESGYENAEIDAKEIEHRLIEVGMSWRHELYNVLIDFFGEEKGVAYFNKYRNSFLASYREAYTPKTAVNDIEHIENLTDERPLGMHFYQSVDRTDNSFKFKVYQRDSAVPLSDALPILENMGFRVIGEKPHQVCFQPDKCVWINDFNMLLTKNVETLDAEKAKDNFQSAFAAVWLKLAENDRFNQLVIVADLNWRQVAVLRAYTKYFQQTGFTFSQSYIAETLINNATITKLLIQYFDTRFHPKEHGTKETQKKLQKIIEKSCDEVKNLAEDRILRHFLIIMKATVRTNYYQNAAHNALAFKLMPKSIPGLPLPIPMFEIFVYSTRFEAVHLRGEKVARGGLRWSDRREDFRTEILGLMKAQQVKNAVIVPLGAKGGFVPKEITSEMSREEAVAEAISCYQTFIRSMLDLTDNIVGENITPPRDVVRYDEDDTYLVVAADKGTATFSDIANAISKEYNFWLGDAFASGGSAGYDHKKMGITARGAWESVKRHFRELDIDVQATPFRVIGIGDMSGDVFGNGMLLSKCIMLVAAFNDKDIFIDPNPDPEISYNERKRLFDLPRSSWGDYDKNLISTGGGVFSRSMKAIMLTPEMKKLFGIKRESLTPNEMISTILHAEVDLLWNGGIGTYVKSINELNTNVGDRANDSVRINAAELCCKVVGEGGNLGFTQLARVEYALNGGKVYTDFIDNSGGVDCSDHEVNIKILLDKIISEDKLTQNQRNKLLAEMTDEVAYLVLRNNYEQTLAISNTADRSRSLVDLYASLISELEHQGYLNRELEYLPSEKSLLERKAENKGLTSPELAVLFAYSKTYLKKQILASDLPEDAYFQKILALEFPIQLRKKFAAEMQGHRLRREIIATQIVNNVINQMGITFVRRVQDETVAPISRILKSFIIAQNIFDKETIWKEIEVLDLKVKVNVQFAMMRQINRLIKRSTRWLLQNRLEQIDIEVVINEFKPAILKLRDSLTGLLNTEEKEKFDSLVKNYVKQNIPQALAEKIAICPAMFSILDIIEAAKNSKLSLEVVASTYITLNNKLEVGWLREQISCYSVTDHWSALARSGFSDDLDFLQRILTVRILSQRGKNMSVENKMTQWFVENAYLIERWQKRVADLKARTSISPIMFYVAIRDFQDLTQSHGKLLVFR